MGCVDCAEDSVSCGTTSAHLGLGCQHAMKQIRCSEDIPPFLPLLGRTLTSALVKRITTLRWSNYAI